MDQQGDFDGSRSRQLSAMSKLSSSAPDIDQLCNLIDESTFGFQPTLIVDQSVGRCSSTCLSPKFRSIPSCQVKAFRSTRLKRLGSSSTKKSDSNDDSHLTSDDDEFPSYRSLYPYARRRFALRFSLSSSLLSRFRSLSTCHFSHSRRSSHLTSNIRSIHAPRSSSSLALHRTQSNLPSITEEDNLGSTPGTTSPLTTSSQMSCTIVDTRRTPANSCNVEELAAYLDNYLYLPKSLSGAAELMYT